MASAVVACCGLRSPSLPNLIRVARGGPDRVSFWGSVLSCCGLDTGGLLWLIVVRCGPLRSGLRLPLVDRCGLSVALWPFAAIMVWASCGPLWAAPWGALTYPVAEQNKIETHTYFSGVVIGGRGG